MTEHKAIYVDGVDVSVCRYFKANYKEDCDVKIDNCCCNTYVPCYSEFKYNCYFKQLARKTQECEELKSVRDSWLSKCEQETKIKEFYQDELNQLKAEKQQAEQKLERIRDIANAIINGHHFTNDIIEHFKELVKMIVQIIDEVE